MGAVMSARRKRLAELISDEGKCFDEFTQRMCDPENPESPYAICKSKDVPFGGLMLSLIHI